VPIVLEATASAADPDSAWRGYLPGVATIDEIIAKLGPTPIATARAGDLRYPSVGQPELSDRLYFRDGKLALVTSASRDDRYPTRAAIEARFGPPEAEIRFQTQTYLDYSERGLRFICDADDEATGVIYFTPRRRRVPVGYPNVRLDLRRELAAPAAAVAPDDFRVGAAQLSISPRSLEKLTAEAVPDLHVAEDLFVRVAVFMRGETQIVLAGLDVFGMGQWDLDRLRESLAKRGFPQVVLALSHTHANVDTIGFYGHYPRDYADFIVRQTEVAVHAAAQNLQPIRELRMGSVEMPLAGGRVVDLIRNGRDPGVVDPTVSILQAIGRDGKPIANVINLACHPEVIDVDETHGLSPDFVGTLCRIVQSRLGGQPVFLNGSLGGMLTPDTPARTQAAAGEMGSRLAEFVIDAAGRAVPSGTYDLWLHRRPVQYPITGESVKAFLEKAPWPLELIDGRIATEMNAVWIGDAQFITVPGELLPDIGLEIMSHMPGRLRMIVGLANGELGYLVPSFDFRAGGYEERTGPGPSGGEITRSVGLEIAPLTPPRHD
jgi:hypothetical protein